MATRETRARHYGKTNQELKVQNYILALIVTIWAIAVLADIVSTSFNVPAEMTAVVGGIIAYFTAGRYTKKGR